MIDPREFEPLPYFPWDDRPASLPLTHDEAATAIRPEAGVEAP
jgi:hypothetical protein